MKQYNKLVRNKIPNIIRGNGEIPKTHTVLGEELRLRLVDKLQEEVGEFLAEGSDVIEECADIFEVLESILKFHGITIEEVFDAKDEKKIKKGGFDEGIILDEVI